MNFDGFVGPLCVRGTRENCIREAWRSDVRGRAIRVRFAATVTAVPRFVFVDRSCSPEGPKESPLVCLQSFHALFGQRGASAFSLARIFASGQVVPCPI